MNPLSVAAIRDILKTKAHLLRAGFPAQSLEVQALEFLAEEYRQQVGRVTYLSQMLGPLATVDVSEAKFYDERGGEMEMSGKGRVIDVLKRAEKWPWKVIVIGKGERYL